MGSYLILLWLLGISSYAHERQTVPCVQLLPELSRQSWGLFQQGTLVEPEDFKAYGLEGLNLKPGTRAFLLGKGSSAYVIRLTSPRGRTSVVKLYRLMDPHSTENLSAEKYQRDLAYLKRFAEATRHNPTETLEVVKVKKTDGGKLVMRLEDFKGFSLLEVLNLLKEESPEKYRAVVKDFNRRLDVFASDLVSAGFPISAVEEDISHPTVHAYTMRLSGLTSIYDIGLHANVLFDPQSGRFMLVDPF